MNIKIDKGELKELERIQTTVLIRKVKLEFDIPDSDKLIVEYSMPCTIYHKEIINGVTVENTQDILKYVGTYVVTVDGYVTTDDGVCYITTNETGSMVTTRYSSLNWLLIALGNIFIRAKDDNLHLLGRELRDTGKRLELLCNDLHKFIDVLLYVSTEERITALTECYNTAFRGVAIYTDGILSTISSQAKLLDKDVAAHLCLSTVDIGDEMIVDSEVLYPVLKDRIEIYRLYVTVAMKVAAELEKQGVYSATIQPN